MATRSDIAGPRPARANPNVQIVVFDSVLERIRSLLLGSKLEEGGKLLGYVEHLAGIGAGAEHSVVVRIEDYIDSGPGQSHSAVHLLPDGDYQDKLFRVVERWAPQLEHVGTWHSHHCNGLSTLSGSDIEGYLDTINDPDYNLDIFVAYLVQRLVARSMEGEFFVFMRGQEGFCTVPRSSIRVIRGSSALHQFLETAEALSRSASSRQPPNHDAAAAESAVRSRGLSRAILLGDKSCLSQHFPGAQLRRGTRTGSLTWQWRVLAAGKAYTLRYTYKKADQATLLALDGSQRVVAQTDIRLDDQRHGHILAFAQALQPGYELGRSEAEAKNK